MTRDPGARRLPYGERGERGTALLETALVTPVFLLILFAIVDFGMLFRTSLSLSDATADAVRWEAIQGPDLRPVQFPRGTGPTAMVSGDYSAVLAIREGTAGIDPDSIDRIVVFEVDRNDMRRGVDPVSLVPPACRTGASSTADRCNVYLARPAFLAIQTGQTSYFNCVSGSGPACGWPPAARDDGPNPVDIDYLGVYVRARHDFVTGFFGQTFELETAKVMRLEPGAIE